MNTRLCVCFELIDPRVKALILVETSTDANEPTTVIVEYRLDNPKPSTFMIDDPFDLAVGMKMKSKIQYLFIFNTPDDTASPPPESDEQIAC